MTLKYTNTDQTEALKRTTIEIMETKLNIHNSLEKEMEYVREKTDSSLSIQTWGEQLAGALVSTSICFHPLPYSIVFNKKR